MSSMVVNCLGPASSYEDICRDLTRAFLKQENIPLQPRTTVRMVGLFFIRPDTGFASTEVIPSLGYYHLRSGKHINFYCAGFEIGWEPARLQPEEQRYFYSDDTFDNLRRDIEARCSWRYSGGADLLILNARDLGRAELDFSCVICANLIKMKAEGAILSVDEYFEKIVRFTEDQSGSDPTWGFSDSLGHQGIVNGLKGLLVAALPKGIQDEAKRAFHNVVRDVSSPISSDQAHD